MNDIDITLQPPAITLPSGAWHFALGECARYSISISTYIESLIIKEQTIAEAERQILRGDPLIAEPVASAPNQNGHGFVPASDADA